MNTIDHLGIAVKSLAEAKKLYRAMGFDIGHEEVVEHEKVRTAMIPTGESRIELLEATSEDSVIAKFIGKRGEGLHHVALRVDDIYGTFRKLQEKGVRLISDEVKVGAGGHLYIFVHPASTGGVLLELCQDQPSSTASR